MSRRTTLVAVALVLAFLAPMSAAYALWSRTASTTTNVSTAPPVPPAAPAISCGAHAGNGLFTITWTNGSGLTYSVHRSTTTNTDAAYASQATGTTSPYTASVADGTTTFWRVRAGDGVSTSGWSNTLRLVRNGNGNGSTTCTTVSP